MTVQEQAEKRPTAVEARAERVEELMKLEASLQDQKERGNAEITEMTMFFKVMVWAGENKGWLPVQPATGFSDHIRKAFRGFVGEHHEAGCFDLSEAIELLREAKIMHPDHTFNIIRVQETRTEWDIVEGETHAA